MRGGGRPRHRTHQLMLSMDPDLSRGILPRAPLRHPRGIIFLAIGLVTLVVVGLILLFSARNDTFLDNSPKLGLVDQFRGGPPQCFRAPDVPRDRRKNKDTLKVVNFNAEWLFLFGGRGGIHCPSDGCAWSNTIEALNHFKDVADTLVKIDADIIHLSEVEDCRALRTLLTLLPLDHGYAPYLILGRDHATGQNTAILTRIDPTQNMMRTEQRTMYPLEGSKCRASGRGSIGVSKHYLIPLTIENSKGKKFPFIFVGLHFLARPDDKIRCPQREAQAAVLSNFIREHTKQNEMLVIMGDFNDYDPNALGTDGRTPITSVLNIMLESSGSERRLVNAASLLPISERYSCWFDANHNCRLDGQREKVMIDHILYDPSLPVINASIHHDYIPTCDKRVSDHWPFSVTFDLTL